MSVTTSPHTSQSKRPDRYKWVVLSNTTLGMLMAMIDTSIVLIALPDIFKGIHMNPLEPGNTFYLLWMILGFMIVTAVLVVSLGRLGDMLGRVRMYNMGFVVYTFFSLMLSITWMSGTAAGIWLVVMRLFQGVGAAFLIANSTAILTDAFPENERGMAVGINQIAAIAGSFIGLILGGLLGPIEWRLVFIISVPVGIFGSIWSYTQLKEVPTKRDTTVDWNGNLTFALGLVALMVGITYGIQPYGGHVMGWTSPFVLSCLVVGVVTLFIFARIETRSPDPMFRLSLFRIRAFTTGSVSTLFSAIGRGGLMFTMVIWLQGIWLPLHGYNFSDTPLWAGIALLPLTGGFLVAGPLCGWLSDKHGARPFTVGGMSGAAISFLLLQFLPANFPYPLFGILLFLNGVAMGMFAAPNRASIMNALPAEHRGVGSGMNSTFQNSGQVLSIGIFFTLMIVGLSRTLPHALYVGLTNEGVPSALARHVASLPPVSTLFASFLGYNPMAHLLGAHALHALPAASRQVIVGRKFFPRIIEKAFVSGLHPALDFAAILCAIAALTSWLRGTTRTLAPGSLPLDVGAPANAD
ncbi:MAG TPA: MFS transporter [Acidimicrobiales bacterium]